MPQPCKINKHLISDFLKSKEIRVCSFGVALISAAMGKAQNIIKNNGNNTAKWENANKPLTI